MKVKKLFLRFHFLRFMVISLIGTMLIAGCSGQTGTSSGENGKELVVAQAANPTSMDPPDTQDTLAYSIQKTMYQGLVGFDKDMNVIPVLAESLPELGSDAKSVTFKLRKNVKFHDGADFNAEAVKANIDRVKDPSVKLKRTSLFEAVEKAEIIDPYTVKIVLNKPFAAIVQTFAHPAATMISPKAIKEHPTEIQRNPVGTGPFQFVEWKDGEHLTVKKFADYWDKEHVAKVDRITFKPVTEAASRVAMLKTGEAGFTFPFPAEQVELVKNDANIDVQTFPSIVVRYIAFNVTKKPFDDKRVRQALNYAIDKDTLIKVIKKGFGEPLESVIASKVWAFQPQKMYEHDVAKAKQLLADAGYANGFETVIWTANSTESVKIAEFIQQQWKEIGVKTTVQQMESGTLTNQLYVKPEENKMQTYSGGWSPSTGEADWGIRPLFSKDLFPPAGYNVGFYVNDQVEKDILTGLQSSDEKERLAAYASAQKTLVEEAPWAFLCVDQIVAGKRKNVSNVFVLPDGSLDVNAAEIQ